MKMQRYAQATLNDMIRVVDAAEKLYAVMAEFPDDPECWEDPMGFFDAALQACPGTAAHEYEQARTRESGND